MVLGDVAEVEKDSLRRLQQLDRQYFPLQSQQNERPRPMVEEMELPLQLPPLTAPSKGTRGQAAQKQTAGGPRKLGTSHGSSPNQGDRGVARRKANFNNSYSYGTNPANPFEAITEATPAIQSLGAKDWQLLDLVVPYGSSTQAMGDLGKDLAIFLTENLKANGARTDTSPGRIHSPLRTAWRPPNLVPSMNGTPSTAHTLVDASNGAAATAMQYMQQMQAELAPAYDPLSPNAARLGGGPQPVPVSPFGVPSRNGLCGESGGTPVAPILAWSDGADVLSSSKPSHLRPPPGAAWWGSPQSTVKLPVPKSAGAQQTAINFERLSTAMAGMTSSKTNAPLEPVSLGQLIGEKNSSRRQVQLMSRWLDAAMEHVDGKVVAEQNGNILGEYEAIPVNTSQRIALAAQFTASGYSSAALTTSAGFSAEARGSMARSVGACASSLVHHIAHACFEDGALMARLWNMHTQVMEAEIYSSHHQVHQLHGDLKEMRDRVRRLDPLIDWDKESRGTIEVQRDSLESATNSLILARAERDALLRENDKIIAHYRKELKVFKALQRRNAYRVARKLKIAQQQMILMQQDREQLIAAVTYTKDQAIMLAKLVRLLHPKIRAVQKAMPDDDFEELEQIEAGLRNILATAEKVSDCSAEAERMHFDVEELVTAVAATDRENDDIVEQILAGGDPDFPNGEPVDDELAAVDFGAIDAAEDDLLPDAESEVDEDDVAAAISTKKPRTPETPTEAPAVEDEADADAAAADAEVEEVAAKALAEEEAKAAAAAEAAATEHRIGAAAGEYKKKKASKKKAKAEAEAVEAAVKAAANSDRPASRSSALKISNETQTDAYEPETVIVEVEVEVAPPSQEPEPLYIVKASEVLLDRTAGLSLSPPLRLDISALSEGGPRHVDMFVDAIMATLNGCKSEIETKAQQIGMIKGQIAQQTEDLHSKDRSNREIRQELVKVTQLYTKLRTSITALGVDPDHPVLPKPPPAEKIYITVSADAAGTEEEDAGAKKGGKKEKKGSSKSASTARDASPRREATPPPPASASKSKTSSPTRERHAKPEEDEVAAKAKAARMRDSSPKIPPRTTSPTRKVHTKSKDDLDASLRVQSNNKALGPDGGPLLGKERIVERREEKTGMQRLEEAVAKYADAKPRTLEWLIKLIDTIYRGKAVSDDQRHKMAQDPLAMVDFMFQHLAGVYGTRDLVNQYCAQIVATMETYRATDARIVTFQRFIMEEWNRTILGIYIEGMKRLSELARVPCCDFPSDYNGNVGRRGLAPTLVDIRKCLSVADKVLMKRTSQASYSFAAALAVKGDPIGEVDLGTYFVAPGYYGPDIVNMRVYEQSRAEFRSVPSYVFLDMMCEEYLRCEMVMLNALPALFKKFDHDDDSFIGRDDIETVLENMAPKGMEVEEIQLQTVIFWKLLEHHELDGNTNGLPAKDSSVLIGFRAFREAAMQSDFIRGYIRLNKTPASKLKLESTEEDLARMLQAIIIRRHWAICGDEICDLFQDMGASAVQMKQQVTSMLRETDGSRMAVALHGLLKSIINRKLDLVVAQLSIEQVHSHGFEDTLMRLTDAMKVLYGADAIIVDDVEKLADKAAMAKTYAQKRSFQRWQANVARIFNRATDNIQPFIFHFLRSHPAMVRFVRYMQKRGHNMTPPTNSGSEVGFDRPMSVPTALHGESWEGTPNISETG